MLTGARAADLAQRCIARARLLATITDVPGTTTRTFLSEGMRRANARVEAWMQEAGLQTWMDAAGNLHGRLPGHTENAPRFLVGSHLDTVPDAGAFDGVLGVLMAIALAGQFRPGTLPFSLEVIAFSEEEGVRFGAPFLGSRALAGTLDAPLLAREDANGISVQEAIASYGLDTAALPKAIVRDAAGFLEFHIEQGPSLEAEDLPVAAVETIAGQSRFRLTFQGSANHAGTTPMHLRHDSMAAAAAFIVAVEQYARSTRGLVATVGSIHAEPNAGNVIAGEVSLSLDVRSASDLLRNDAVSHLLASARAAGDDRGVRVTSELRMEQPAVPLDRGLLHVLEDSIDDHATLIRRIVSGAGHDAMILAPHMPAAMLFLRSPGGVSHHASEAVHADDVALALRIGARFLERLSQQQENGE